MPASGRYVVPSISMQNMHSERDLPHRRVLGPNTKVNPNEHLLSFADREWSLAASRTSGNQK